MALNFNEGAYGQAYQQGQANRQADRDRLLQLIQSVGPAISEIGQGYEQRKADNATLDQLLSSNQLSAPVSPLERIDSMQPNQMMDFNQLPNNPMGMAPQSEVPQARPGNHVEGFQNFLKGQTQPQPQAQPQPMQQQPSPFGQYGRMTVGQLRRLPEVVQKSMFQSQKPEPENYSFIGTNDQGQAVFADKAGNMKIGALPTGGKLQPKPTATATSAGIKPPAGYRFTEDGNLEAIPGGPAMQKSLSMNEKLGSTYELYKTARDGLLTSLQGSMTGPIMGKIPALTSAQQTAQGGVAAMAPVLKQLFRVAGEGVFTDRDQALLMQMIPTRETLPEARTAQINNIDAIVRAKLGIKDDGQTQTGQPQGQAPIVQRNKKTGQIRTSYDGGLTWQ